MSCTTDVLEQRIVALEEQMRQTHRRAARYRLAATALGVGLVGMVTVAASMGPDIAEVIQARRFEVIDQDGHVVVAASAGAAGGELNVWSADEHRNVGRLWVNEHGGDLAIWNNSGRNVLGAFATPTGGEISIWNADGIRALLGDAGPAGGRLEVHDYRQQKPVLAASTSEHGGTITVAGPSGRGVWEVRATEAGAYTAIASPTGQVLMTSRATEAGGSLGIHNAVGAEVLTATIDGRGAGRLRLTNGAGRRSFMAGSGERGGVTEIYGEGDSPVVLSGASLDQGGGRIEVANESGNIVFSVNAVGDTGAALELMSGQGARQFAVGTRLQGGLMNIMNSLGQPVVIAGTADEGLGGAVSIKNGDGRQILHAGYDSAGDGLLNVWDTTGSKTANLTPRR